MEASILEISITLCLASIIKKKDLISNTNPEKHIIQNQIIKDILNFSGALSGLDRKVGNAVAPTANMYVDRYCHLSLFTRFWVMILMLMDFEEWKISLTEGH